MDESIRTGSDVCARGVNRNRIPRLALGAALVCIGGTGCQRPIQPEAPSAAVLGEPADWNRIWNGTLSILRKHDFEPDRQDRAARVIETLPTTSKQWHEPWRQDVADAYSLREASLHTIRRKATVRFSQGDPLTVEVQVDVYRLSALETQITSASSVLHGFTGVLPTVEGRVFEPGSEPVHLVPLRRDGRMEERLLRRIAGLANDVN